MIDDGAPTANDLRDPAVMASLVADLLPLPRSLTGDGVRDSIARIARHVPVATVEVPTGTPALDWEVPQEWTLRNARLTGPDGVVVDVASHPLHVLGYSTAVDEVLDRRTLDAHLYSDPDQPDVIPYRTSYYTPRWGFCLSDALRRALPEGDYHAVIDADLQPGHMSYGELVLPGATDEEVLVTSHVCHPGMANDNVSGNVVAAALAQQVSAMPDRQRTWRFLWLPGTIGELTWLATHMEVVDRIVGGLVLAGVGDSGTLTYKRSRRGDAPMDRTAELVGQRHGVPAELVDFSPWGYAERQFCSPGFNLGFGRLSRTEHGTYPQYHTSDDDLSFVSVAAMQETAAVSFAMAEVMDANATYLNLKPHGEPRLGPRGLYPTMGGPAAEEAQLALLWVLSWSDGRADLVDVARRSGLPFSAVARAATALARTDLLIRDEGVG